MKAFFHFLSNHFLLEIISLPVPVKSKLRVFKTHRSAIEIVASMRLITCCLVHLLYLLVFRAAAALATMDYMLLAIGQLTTTWLLSSADVEEEPCTFVSIDQNVLLIYLVRSS